MIDALKKRQTEETTLRQLEAGGNKAGQKSYKYDLLPRSLSK